MPKYSDRPCARCGKMMLHAYCSQRYCKACAPLVRSDEQRRCHHQPGQAAQQTCPCHQRQRGARRQGRRYELR